MPDSIFQWMGDVHAILPGHWVGVVVTVSAILCGGVIGFERERAQKAAGLRTLVLICLGSAFFTQASILMADSTGDRGRIAAQIVSGIGFLGAGAIIREGGLITGITTAASIWATAGVGVVLGSGYVAAGYFFAFLIVVTLSTAKFVDRIALGRCSYVTLEMTYRPHAGKTRFAIQAILDEHITANQMTYDETGDEFHVLRMRYCKAHREHRLYINQLLDLPEITAARLV